MVGYANNHTGDTYKLYIPEVKRVIMARDVTWEEWKMTDPAENLKTFCYLHEYIWCQVYRKTILTR